jgi:hypothetical protein
MHMTQSPGSLPRRRWRRAGRGAAALLALALLAVMGGSPSTTPAAHAQTAAASGDDFYGLNFVQPSDPWLTLARDSGAHTVRWQFNWRDIEPSPGSWNWSFSDSAIPAWNKAGIKVDALLHNPPDWAKINPTGLVPANAQLAWNDPANGWAQYCYQRARHRGLLGGNGTAVLLCA